MREDPAVLDYLKQENTCGEMMMAENEALRHQLFTEMVEHIP
nr:hypothetical protein [Sodalis-like endosymbiont of Proechinophthirus fluctus]